VIVTFEGLQVATAAAEAEEIERFFVIPQLQELAP
jgi:hypothetical protein